MPNATQAASSNASVPLPTISYKQQKQQPQQLAQQQPLLAANSTANKGLVRHAAAVVLSTNTSATATAVPIRNTSAILNKGQQPNTTAASAAEVRGGTALTASNAAESPAIPANTSKAASPSIPPAAAVAAAGNSKAATAATASTAAAAVVPSPTAAAGTIPAVGPVIKYEAVKDPKEQAQVFATVDRWLLL